MVMAAGFEPATVCLEGRCSIQLSYATINESLFLRCPRKEVNVSPAESLNQLLTSITVTY